MLFGTQTIKENELHIGGISASNLVKKHGSPLYVYDEQHMIDMINLFKDNFKSEVFNTRIAYASKAFLTKSMVRMIDDHNLSIDLVSGGEMYTALSAGFTMSNSIIHGNNKSIEELTMALKSGVGYIVVDSIYELEVLITLSNELQLPVKTLLRVNPGIEAHTHEYIITAKLTSKFGESIFDTKRIDSIVELYQGSSLVELSGFHCHIGSQVFGIEPFTKTVQVMTEFIKGVEDRHSVEITALNIGGGFGVYYTDEDNPERLEVLLQQVISETEKVIKDNSLNINELIIEPGRSIVSNAGTTLYEVGYKKETFGGKDYLFVNGGMTDNIRPALYQAKYSADIATNMNGSKSGSWTIAGKLCESGDLLIKDAPLQEFKRSDVLAIYTTGAYNYSMASNYNRILKPCVVFVKDGLSKEVVKRETFEDLIRNDL